jgi:hypothetical protein
MSEKVVDNATLRQQMQKRKDEIAYENAITALAERREKISTDFEQLNSSLETVSNDFDAWNRHSSVESTKPKFAIARFMEDMEKRNDKTISALQNVSESFGKLASSTKLDEEFDENKNSDVFAGDLGELSIADILGTEYKKKIGTASAKLANIFAAGKKQYNDVLTSIIPADDVSESMDGDLKTGNTADSDVASALIPMLQQKVVQLKKELELAQMKSRSVTVQW